MPSYFSKQVYKDVAKLHIQNLDQGFLGQLGVTFLSEMYRAIDRSDDNTLIVDIIDNQSVGFVTGGRSMGSIYKAMFPRIWVWGVPLGLRLLSPKRLMRVLDILRYDGDKVDDDVSAELFSIAVAPTARGQGVAPRLYEGLIAYFRDIGEPAFRIIVGDALAPAHGFYTKMGAKAVGQIEVHKGEGSVLYRHDIDR